MAIAGLEAVLADAHADDDDAREERRVLRRSPSITPGTPTHSKTTGNFGPAPSLLGEAPDVPPADRQLAELLARARPRARARRACSSSWPLASPTYGDSARGVDDDVGAARRGERAAAGREVARHHLPHAARLEHQDHAEADRPAADDDRDLALLRPRRGAPRATRRPSARSARRRRPAARSGRAA